MQSISHFVLLQVGNLTEVLIPFVKYRMRISAEKRDDGEENKGKVERTQAEKGLHLEVYDREYYHEHRGTNKNLIAIKLIVYHVRYDFIVLPSLEARQIFFKLQVV